MFSQTLSCIQILKNFHKFDVFPYSVLIYMNIRFGVKGFEKVCYLFFDVKPSIDKLSTDIKSFLSQLSPLIPIYNPEKSFHDVTKELASFM